MDHYERDDIIDHPKIRRCLINIARSNVGCPMTKAKRGQILKGEPEKYLKEYPLNRLDIEDAYANLKEINKSLLTSEHLTDNSQLPPRHFMQILTLEAEILFADAMLNQAKHDVFKDRLVKCQVSLLKAYSVAEQQGFREVQCIVPFSDVVKSFIPEETISVKSCKDQQVLNSGEEDFSSPSIPSSGNSSSEESFEFVPKTQNDRQF